MSITFFPVVNPQYRTRDRLSSDPRSSYDKKLKRKWFATLRNMSSGFVARKDVREIIFSRDGYACKKCGSSENLTVDHIISVSSCYCGHISIELLNTESNLQTLCKSCNCKKSDNNAY